MTEQALLQSAQNRAREVLPRPTTTQEVLARIQSMPQQYGSGWFGVIGTNNISNGDIVCVCLMLHEISRCGHRDVTIDTV